VHPSVTDFAADALQPEDVTGMVVVEAGSFDVNGSLRPLVEAHRPACYIGTDMRPGPGVDVVCPAGDLPAKFGDSCAGLVISTEMLEHAEHWQDAMAGMIGILAPGGVLLLTTRSEGFGYHDHPGDFWRFSVAAMRFILGAAGLHIARCEPDPQKGSPGVFAKAAKPARWVWAGPPAGWAAAGVTRIDASGG